MNRYEELKRVASSYYKDHNYCTVIALAVTCNLKFGKSKAIMSRNGRVTGKGACLPIIEQAIAEAGHRVVKKSYSVGGTMSTVASRLDSSKTYMVFVRGHVAAVRDGIVQDWTEGRRHRVQVVWEIEKA